MSTTSRINPTKPDLIHEGRAAQRKTAIDRATEATEGAGIELGNAAKRIVKDGPRK
jgi:hypothetical protein